MRRYALVAAVALAVLALSWRQASYGAVARAEAASVVWWAVLVVLVAGGVRLGRVGPFAAIGGLLAGLTAWTALSLVWAASADQVVPEIVLVSFYLGVFIAVALLARADTLAAWCDGLALGIGLVAGAALLSRFFPDLFEGARAGISILPGSASRLAFPVGYWNGLGYLVACAVPLVLRSAIAERGGLVRKVLSAGFLPAVGTVVYLTSSRGSALVAFAAALLYVGLSGSRWTSAAGALAVGGAGGAAAIAVVARQADLVDHPFGAAAADVGPETFVALVLVCAATGLAFAAVQRFVRFPWRLSGRAAAIVAMGAVAIVAAFLAADAKSRFDAFTAPPAPDASQGTVRGHLASSNSSGRWQLWSAAAAEFRNEPIRGRGAGSYESWWAEHGTIRGFVRNAHSLYLESLGELGIVGGSILAAFVLGGLFLGLRVVRASSARYRYQPAAPLAAFAAFALAAAGDWVWELPLVGAVGVGSLAILVGASSTNRSFVPSRGAAGRAVAVGVAVVAVALFAVATVDAFAQRRLRESEHAAARGDRGAAVGNAQAARALEPWSATPLLRLALAEERFGSLAVARTAIEQAVRKDPSDWRLRLVAARLQAKNGDIAAATRSLAEARRLNPRSPLFVGR